MDIHQAIYGRRAVRDFSPAAIDPQVINRLIDAAIQAPTALNQQPWTFTVVRDQRTLDAVSTQAKSHMLAQRSELPGSGHFQMLKDPHFQIFYHAPVLILISATAAVPWCVEDCALAAQNLMLAAFAEGLGTCWIGFAQSYLGTPAGKALLRLPPASIPVAPIILGAARGQVPAVARNKTDICWIG